MPGLGRFIVARVLLAIPTILILLTIVFIVMRLIPGNPILAMVGMKAPPEYVEELMHKAGLDKPLYIQYIDYLSGIFKGDLGRSLIWGRRPVIAEIMDHFPATLELTIFAFIIAVFLGTTTGVFGSSLRVIKGWHKFDSLMRIYGIISWTLFIPWIGMLLQLIFGVWLRVLPVAGRIDPGLEPPRITGLYVIDSIITQRWDSLISALRHLVLPSITLGLVISGAFTRIVRNNMIEIFKQDFMMTYKAVGVSTWKFISAAFRNAFIPIMTIMGLQFAYLLAGAVLTETTFSWPGMGTFLVERITYADYTTVQGTVVFFAIIVVTINLIVDIIYAFIDPRIRY
ncbi:MAG: peptide ABC transporter permease [Desulfurococcales archaeon ex4484_42]|nr:MAG: peptide ABC transporter permease [Desulfurococcales archaeon ex4484_42]